MNLKSIFFLVVFSLLNVAAEAQQIVIRPLAYFGIYNNVESGYFYNGGGLELGYTHEVKKGRVTGGANYRLIHWGHQIGLNLGYDYPFWEQDGWRASIHSSAELAVALFVQKPLLGWSVNCMPTLEWQSQKAFSAHIGLGLQFNNNPPYSEYGAIYSTLDIPLRMGVGFKLGKASRVE